VKLIIAVLPIFRRGRARYRLKRAPFFKVNPTLLYSGSMVLAFLELAPAFVKGFSTSENRKNSVGSHG